jgi:GT2 family glycosyltransferase
LAAHLLTSHEVGVVAIGRNEGGRLIACLASLKSETDKVVYVDSGSTDGSAAAAEKMGASAINLDLTRPFTAARARNEGFTALKAIDPDVGFVQFIDGDCTLAQGWLDTAVDFMKQRKDVAVVCGRLRERYPTASIYNRLCDFEWNTPIGEAVACGGNALVRVEAFEAAGGFRLQLIAGEEPELCLRLRERGWKIWRLDAEMGLHDAAMTRFGQWWVRSVRCGYAMAEVSQLHSTSPLGIWRREMASSVFWGGLLPIAICLGALIHPGVLGGALAYFLQLCRMALTRGPASSQSWTWAAFLLLAKFPEFQGILKFLWLKSRHRPGTLIEYK